MLKTTFPILASSIRRINWPSDWSKIPVGVGGAQFAIDCTAHYRNRVHPGQHLWYRGDKRAHFMSAQVVITLTGEIISVHFVAGHNNDQGVFNITLKERIEQLNIMGITDRGYSHFLLISANDLPLDLQATQAAQRAMNEIVIGLSKLWEYAAGKVAHPPEMQALGLRIIYEITNLRLKQISPSCTSFNKIFLAKYETVFYS